MRNDLLPRTLAGIRMLAKVCCGLMLLMGLPPTVIVTMLIMNASFIRPLFDDPIGHALLAAGITLQTVGYFVIRRIIQIQV